MNRNLITNICSSKLSHFLLQDGDLTNIDFIATGIETENLNSETLGDFLVGRSASFPENSGHSGQFSDVNIWDYALTKNQIIKWTSCK